jgi:YD repeat-containing protein
MKLQSDGLGIEAAAGDPAKHPGATYLPNGNAVAHRYDGMNRLIATSDSLGAVESYTYDANGQRLTETDANGSDGLRGRAEGQRVRTVFIPRSAMPLEATSPRNDWYSCHPLLLKNIRSPMVTARVVRPVIPASR